MMENEFDPAGYGPQTDPYGLDPSKSRGGDPATSDAIAWYDDGTYMYIDEGQVDELGPSSGGGWTITDKDQNVIWEGGVRAGSSPASETFSSGGESGSPYDETLRANPRGYPSDATATDRARLFEAETNAARQSKKSDTATDEDDATTSSGSGGSTWTDWDDSGDWSGSSSYGSGGGSSSNPYSPVGAMRGAGMNAGAMGMALRGAMGAPMPYMPGQDGGGGDDERQSVYNPGGGAYVASGGVPQAAPAPSGEGRYPPWPGAYQTRQALAGAGGGGGGSAPAAPAMGPYAAGRRPVPRIQPPGQTAGRGFPAPSSQRGRGKPPARRGRK